MYLSFYRLKLKPFQNSTNPSFFWLGERHKEALAIFKYGILKMPGMLVLTGDVGTGKTTLINALINNLGDNFIVIKVPDPGLEEIDFLGYVSDTLDFKKQIASKESFFHYFSHFLHKSSLVGKKVLLVIDECQRLSSSLLAEIIKLTDIEQDTRKSLKVLLIGQNEFNDVVLKKNNRALDQLISINYGIEPLNLSETGEFIKHRLKIAGAKKEIFTPDAITKIYQFSAGIPRRINNICEHALLAGFGQRAKIINGDLVRRSAEDLPHINFSQDLKSDAQDSSAHEELKKTRMISPKLRKNTSVSRGGRAFGILFLITIPIFLILYFSGQMTHRDFIDSVKTGGTRIVNTLKGRYGESRNSSSQPDQLKTSIGPKETSDIALLPEKVMPDEDATGESEPPVSELSKDEKIDGRMQVTIKSSWKDGLPAIVPIGTDIDDGHQTNGQIIFPLLSGQQGAAIEKNTESGRILSGTAAEPQSTNGPDLTGAVDIENETTLNENDAAPADIISPATEMTSLTEAPDIRVSGESNAEAKDSLTKENEMKMNSSVVLSKNPEMPKNLPDRPVAPEKLPVASEPSDNNQEKVDPGAVIDWILEKRSR